MAKRKVKASTDFRRYIKKIYTKRIPGEFSLAVEIELLGCGHKIVGSVSHLAKGTRLRVYCTECERNNREADKC